MARLRGRKRPAFAGTPGMLGDSTKRVSVGEPPQGPGQATMPSQPPAATSAAPQSAAAPTVNALADQDYSKPVQALRFDFGGMFNALDQMVGRRSLSDTEES